MNFDEWLMHRRATHLRWWMCGVICLLSVLPFVADGADGGLTREEAADRFGELQQQRTKEGLPLLELTDLIALYSDDAKRAYLAEAASKDAGFVLFKGRWELIDSPRVALAWAMHEDEPMPTEALKVLARSLEQSSDPVERFRIACFLYQHNDARGLAYLRGQLPASREAAQILAANREAIPTEQLRTLYAPVDGVDVHALALSGGLDARQALVDGATGKSALQVHYLSALCLYRPALGKEDLSRIEEVMARDDSSLRRLAAAGVLLRHADGIVQRDAGKYLNDCLMGRDVSESRVINRVMAAWAASRADPKQMVTGLRNILTSCIESKDREVGSVERYAVEGLAATRLAPNDALIEGVIKKMVAEQARRGRIDAMIYAGVSNGGPELKARLLKDAPAEDAKSIEAVAALKWLPKKWCSPAVSGYASALGPLD